MANSYHENDKKIVAIVALEVGTHKIDVFHIGMSVFDRNSAYESCLNSPSFFLVCGLFEL